jgi:hypothetical protein
MITIFCEFGQISGKKLEFFSKTDVFIKSFQNLALFLSPKRQFFANFFQNLAVF